MTMSMSDEDFIHRAESTGINIETISTVENLKICHICTHECASESLFELHRAARKSDCGYEAESLDCLIMHENQEHYGLSVTIIESAVDEIVDLPKKKKLIQILIQTLKS